MTCDARFVAGFCQAREKISARLLRHLLQQASSRFSGEFADCATWHDRRVFAVDGSKFNLGRSDELDSHFGAPGSAHFPQALVSTLVNVASALPHDVRIAPYASCERALLLEHLDVLEPGDVVVLDRGYPSHDVLRTLVARDIDFLVRVPASHTFEAVEVFQHSGGDDYRVMIHPPKKAAKGLASIELRAVRLQNAEGEESFYLTSLRRSKFSRAEIAELYRRRWQAEELYKTEKASYFDQRQFHARQFHARTGHGVEQEIFAQALFVVIARFLLATAAERTGAEYDQLSIKGAILGLADYVTRICLDDPDSAATWLPRLLARIARTRDKRRPGRSFPRRSFKPGPKWTPTGRKGG